MNGSSHVSRVDIVGTVIGLGCLLSASATGLMSLDGFQRLRVITSQTFTTLDPMYEKEIF